MFTGIIEEIGIIKNIKSNTSSMELTIQVKTVLSDIKLGDSIAVNGTCLTVTKFNNETFSVDVMPETFNTTALKLLKISSPVNLERALSASSRLGGHFVSGHIDGTGVIVSIEPVANAVNYRIKLTPELLTYCIDHGSIAVDGTSLTIFGVSQDSIQLALIPHTVKNSVLGSKEIGDLVNIECDMLNKFVTNLILRQQGNLNKSRLNTEFLAQNGF
jgi:riboflavin synthase